MSLFLKSLPFYLTFIVFLSGCAGTEKMPLRLSQITQTPITESPSGATLPGKFIWHDLLTDDPEKAGQFYQALFGWQITYREKYAIVRNEGKLIASILKPNSSHSANKKGLWIPSASVPDIEAAAQQVKAHGGTVLKGPIDMGQRGQAILISDPQRADLVLLNAKGGDPADTAAKIGDWLWDEIWTQNIDATSSFYSAILGYDELISSAGYRVFLHNDKWRAGTRRVDNDVKHTQWLPVVRVHDVQASAKHAEELGGTVWVAPKDTPGNANTALIADTTGALLLIQRWASPTTPARVLKSEL